MSATSSAVKVSCEIDPNIQIGIPPTLIEQDIVRRVYQLFRTNRETYLEKIKEILSQKDVNPLRMIYLLAQARGGKIAQVLDKLGICDQKTLIFLTRVCIHSNGTAVKYIEQIGIEDDNEINKLTREGFICIITTTLNGNSRKITSAITCESVKKRCQIDSEFVSSFFSSLMPGVEDYEKPLSSILEYAKKRFEPSSAVMEYLTWKRIDILQNPSLYVSRVMTHWLGVAMLILSLSDKERIELFMRTKLLEACYHLRSPTLRIALLNDIAEVLLLPSFQIENLINSKKNIPTILKMACLLLETQQVKSEILIQFQNAVPNKIKKDDRKFVILIELLRHLIRSMELSIEFKENAIKYLSNIPKENKFKSYRDKVSTLLTIFLFQEHKLLENYNFDEKKTLEHLFFDKLKIPNDPMMVERFQKLLVNHPRLKGKFPVYVGKIARLGEQHCFEEIVTFIHAVIHDRFLALRKQIVGNTHMESIRDHYQIVFNRWMSLGEYTAMPKEDDQYLERCANHYLDFLCLGIDIIQSCLVLDGNPERTRTLMERILNPKHQYLMLVDQKGLIAARVKISLLISEIGPVCLIEDPYDNRKEKDYPKRLEQFAIKIAQILEVPLVTRGNSKYPWNKNEPFHYSLHSYPSNFSYEYIEHVEYLDYVLNDTAPNGKYILDRDLWII